MVATYNKRGKEITGITFDPLHTGPGDIRGRPLPHSATATYATSVGVVISGLLSSVSCEVHGGLNSMDFERINNQAASSSSSHTQNTSHSSTSNAVFSERTPVRSSSRLKAAKEKGKDREENSNNSSGSDQSSVCFLELAVLSLALHHLFY